MSYPPNLAPVPPMAATVSGGARAAGLTVGASTTLMGLMAGLFWGFDISVMPGLADSDDLTFVTAMQNINAAIENVLFGAVFVGAFVLPAIATVLLFSTARRAAAAWTLVAVACYLVTLALTMGVEVPLNDRLAAAGDPSRITDLAAVRADFEGLWVGVNVARTLTCTAAVVCLSRALVLYGRKNPLARG
ncbi:DUF1772 domain-containing protein [Micromonospora sp. NPDC051925]|uniref:DUF1772 domain-containing protein n=1 Tax=Micromonospora sp. NPDC051925 TaxID=3364288 RepID=UPI0037C6287C